MEKIKSYFKFEERKTSFSKESIGGLTTFLAMAYILFVNPNILSQTGMDPAAIFTATAIAAIVGTLLMGLLANFPVAQAPGMGLNAFFTYTICLTYGATWQEGLALVFISGCIFLIISITGLRKLIIESIPKDLKLAIGAGIGLFIAFVGLQNAGVIVGGATLVEMGQLRGDALLTFIGLIITVVLYCKKVKGSILLGIIITSIIGMFMGLVSLPTGVFDLPSAANFGAFLNGFSTLDFSNVGNIFAIVFSLLFIDFFDTTGTLISVGRVAGLVNDKGELEGGSKALISDATATIVGAMVGTSNTTSYIESLSGIEAGARTGFASVITALLFFVSMFFYPLLSVVTSACTAPALIFVGVLMARQLKDIEWQNISVAITSFLVILMMPLAYSIAQGIAVGFIFYPISMIATGKGKEVNKVMYVLAVIFMLYFLFAIR